METFGHSRRILAAHNDAALLKLVNRMLRLEGYHVLSTTEGKTAVRLSREVRPALVLLDMAGDGLRICEDIRQFSNVPVIILSNAGETDDIVRSLEHGADAHVIKPFAAAELVSRVNAILRRTEAPGRAVSHLISDELFIDFNRGLVTLAGEVVDLSPREYEVLSLLAGDAGRTCSHRDILTQVWGESYAGNSHVLQMTVGRLRKKIKDSAANPRHIVTRSGIGYLFRMTRPAPGRAIPLAR